MPTALALLVLAGCAHGRQQVGGLEFTLPDGFDRRGTVEEGVVFTSADGRTKVEAFVAEASPPCTVPNACRDRLLMEVDTERSLKRLPGSAVSGFRVGAFEVVRVPNCSGDTATPGCVVYLASSDGSVTWVLRVTGPRGEAEAVSQTLANSIQFGKAR